MWNNNIKLGWPSKDVVMFGVIIINKKKVKNGVLDLDKLGTNIH